MEEKMKMIRQRIKEAQDRQKIYVDAHRTRHSYEVSDRVFLWEKLHKSSIKFRKGDKLSPTFMGAFEVVEMKRLVAYQLAFLDSFRRMHDFFMYLS
jgi:pyridoxine/pyridoxamine 5'-phosphate oxidase